MVNCLSYRENIYRENFNSNYTISVNIDKAICGSQIVLSTLIVISLNLVFVHRCGKYNIIKKGEKIKNTNKNPPLVEFVIELLTDRPAGRTNTSNPRGTNNGSSFLSVAWAE